MWWKDAKLYELYIDKFAGDLTGLTAKLDYFTALGINTLHLLPHYPSPMVDDGYDVSDYRGVRPELGTLDDFKALVREAHARNIRIITDFVLNHTSREHPWFIEARSSKDNPKRDWYLWSAAGTEFPDASNPFPDFKPKNWIYSSDTDDYYFATFYPGQPDLNWDNPEVFDAMVGTMEFWAELGVDGFRLDAVPHIVKREGTACRDLPETHEVIRQIRKRLEKRYPEVILLAEAAQDIELVKTYFGRGDECHMAYNFPLMCEMWMALMETQEKSPEASTASFQGERRGIFPASPRLQKIVDESKDIPHNCQWATFLRNHDEIWLDSLSDADRERLVAWMDPEHRYPFRNNTTTSMRVGSIFRGDAQKIFEAFALLYAQPGAPIMYYGDELGQLNEHNIEFMLDTRRHVRGAFNWPLAESQQADPESLLTRTAALITARPLRADDNDVHAAPRRRRRAPTHDTKVAGA